MPTYKRILMILYGYFPSDPRVRKEVNSLLKDENNSISIICLNQDQSTINERIEVIPIMPKVSINKRESVINLLTFWFLTTIFLLKQGNELIIHAHDLTGLPPIIIPSLFLRVKHVVYDSHELFPEAARDELGWIYGIFFLILEKFCIFFVDIIIGVNQYQGDLMKKRYNKPFILLPNFPSIALINQLYEEPKLNLEKDLFNIICHGAVRKDRGFLLLMDIMSLAQKNSKKWKLYIIGMGPDLELIKDYAQNLQLKNVIFMRSLPFKETFQYLRSGDLAIGLYKIIPSTCFSSSNKLYECMAAGIPSIFSDLKGSREIMKEGLVTRVNPNDFKQVYKAMSEIAKNKIFREKASIKGKAIFQKKYYWENIEIDLRNIYNKIN